ncbi:MAG: hypothetical protein Q7Q73_04560 [Verrucomicrobiota bacterium JB024]|nr:hypothetical protein [Verrucomicrobiota bacterium JB024]
MKKFPHLITRVSPLALGAALLLFAQPVIAQTCDFSSFSAGTKLSPGEKFPNAKDGPFIFQCYAPTGATAGGTIVSNPVDGTKMLQLTTNGKNGQPFSWVGQAAPVQAEGKTLEWTVTFSVPDIGDGSGVYVALVGGESVGAKSWALDQFQPIRGQLQAPLSAKPSMVLGMNILHNMQAHVRYLADESGTTGTVASFSGNGKNWVVGTGASAAKLNSTDTYQYAMKYDGSRGEFSFELKNLKTRNTMAAGSFPASKLVSSLDIKRLRLVVGDIMSNSSYGVTLNIHSIEIQN